MSTGVLPWIFQYWQGAVCVLNQRSKSRIVPPRIWPFPSALICSRKPDQSS